MSLLSPVVAPTTVYNGACVSLVQGRTNVVLYRQHRLEVYNALTGMELLHSAVVPHEVKALGALTIEGNRPDWLVYTTATGVIHILRFKDGNFETIHSAELETQGVEANHQHFLASNSKFLAVNMFKGHIHVFRIPKKPRAGETVEDVFKNNAIVSIEFVDILDMVFVNDQLLAVLYKEDRQVLVSYVRINEKNLQCKTVGKSVAAPGAKGLIAGMDGVFVYGKLLNHLEAPTAENERNLKLNKLRKFDYPVVSACKIDDHRVLAATKVGELTLITLNGTMHEMLTKMAPDLYPAGYVPKPSKLLHVSSNYFMSISTSESSVLFQLDRRSGEAMVLQEVEAISGVSDLVYYNDYGSQTVLLASGDMTYGRVNSLKRGKAFDVQLEFELEDIHNLWAVNDKVLVVSGFGHTTVLEISGDSVEQLHNWPINPDIESILVGCINDKVYQVTTEGINELKCHVTVAAICENTICYAAGSELHRLTSSLGAVASHNFDQQVAQIASDGTNVVVSFWHSSQILVLDKMLEIIQRYELGIDGLIRSLIVGPHQTIFVGFADGQLARIKDGSTTIIEAGPEPVSLGLCSEGVLAWSHYCFFPVYSKSSKEYSPIAIDLHSPSSVTSFGKGKLAYATGNTIRVGKLGDHKRLVSTSKVGGTPVALQQFEHWFVVLVMTPNGGKILLLDASLQQIDQMEFHDELPTCIENIHTDEFTGFVVGTGHESTEDTSPGNLLLFSVKEHKMYLHYTLPVNGEVHAVTFSDQFTVPSTQFLASVGKQVLAVTIARPDIEENFQMAVLNLPREFKSASYTISMCSSKNAVIMGDLMRGAWLMRFEPGEAIERVQFGFARLSGRVIACELSGRAVLTSDALNKTLTYSTLNKQNGVLEYTARVRVDSCVTAIKPAPPELYQSSVAEPRFIVATADGGVYVVSAMAKKYRVVLEDLWTVAYGTRKYGEGEYEKVPDPNPFPFADFEVLQQFGPGLNPDQKDARDVSECKQAILDTAGSASLLSPDPDGYYI